MPRLQLESATDTFNLDEVLDAGRGVQALSGATGLGLPPVAVQWLEGAGDGAIYRGRRVLPRDIDLPLLIQAQDREGLKELLSRVARMLSGPCILRLVEDDGTSWSTEVVRVGGGNYTYGVDSIGENDFFTVITLRAGDPYFTFSRASRVAVTQSGSSGGLLGSGGLASMTVTSSQTIGEIQLENTGDASAYPLWQVYGPGDNFKAVSPTGETIHWQGALTSTDILTVDTRKGTVVDQTGANRYSLLATAPRFWTIPPGIITAEASLLNTSPGTLTAGDEQRRNYAMDPRATAAPGNGVMGWHPRWYGPGGGAGVSRWLKPNDEIRRNYAPNPSAEVDITTGLTARLVGTCTGETRSRVADTGGGSNYVFDVSADFSTDLNQIGWYFDVPIAAGERMSVAMMARLTSSLSEQHLRLYIDWYDSTNTVIPNAGVTSITSQTTWQRTYMQDKVAPTGTTFARVYFWAASNVVGVLSARFDQIIVTKAAFVGKYFDGSTADTPDCIYDWAGTAHVSQSTEKVATGTGPLGINTFARKTWTTAPTGNGDTGYQHFTNAGGTLTLPVVPDEVYTLSTYLRPIGTDKVALSKVGFYDSAGAQVGSVLNGSTVPCPANQWTQVSMTVKVPAGAAYMFPITDIAGQGTVWAVGDTLDGTALLVEKASTLDDYFDGDTPDNDLHIYDWTGTVNASASKQSEAVITGRSKIECTWQPRKWMVI